METGKTIIIGILVYIALFLALGEMIGWIIQGGQTMEQFAEYYIWGFVISNFLIGYPYSWWIALILVFPVTYYIAKTF
jgi:hypothetical protein